MRTTTLFFLILTGSALGGCSSLSRAPYERPALSLPGQFEHTSTTGGIAPSQRWWRDFGDLQLDAWVDLAFARNADLAVAAIRVRRTALAAQLAGSALRPPQPAASARACFVRFRAKHPPLPEARAVTSV